MNNSRYTYEMTVELVDAYTKAEDKEAIIEEYCEKFNKTKKSIIGKLAKEGVYQRKVYKTKTGEQVIKKLEIIHRIAVALDGDPERLAGLEKSFKRDLLYLLELIEKDKLSLLGIKQQAAAGGSFASISCNSSNSNSISCNSSNSNSISCNSSNSNSISCNSSNSNSISCNSSNSNSISCNSSNSNNNESKIIFNKLR